MGSSAIWNQVESTSVGVSVLDLCEDVYMIVQRLRYWRIIKTNDMYRQYDNLYVSRLHVLDTTSYLKM